MEIFDIVDENGKPTGETVERTLAHAEGIRHRTAHIWIARKSGGKWQVLLQKRAMTKDSFPGRYDTSSAGHIQAGDEPLESAIRELEEELGIVARGEQLHYAGTFRIQYEKEFHGKLFKDNEIAFVYVYLEAMDIDKISVQEEELECVEWFDLNEVYRECRAHNNKFCVPIQGLETVMNYLEKADASSPAVLYRPRQRMEYQAHLVKTPVKEGWESAWAGINMYTGIPCIEYGRQKWIMHNCTGEIERRNISYKELGQFLHADITADNWRQFIPQERLSEYESLCTPPMPLPADRSECECKEACYVDACWIHLLTYADGFKKEIMYFRKCEDGYRALYVAPDYTDPRWSDRILSEEEIREQYRSQEVYDMYDRLLSEDEVAYFFNRFVTLDETRNSLGIVSTGKEPKATMRIRMDGLEVTEDKNVPLCVKIADCIRILAVQGIVCG